MKKCPVCGVEHSDIVHVCSICGSPLDGVNPVQSAPEAPVEAPAEAPVNNVPTEDFATDDIRKTISSVVNATVEEEPAPAGDEELSSPFVIDATGDAAQDMSKTMVRPPRRSRKRRSSRPRPEVDTAAVAAESAKKVYEATQNAINARSAQGQQAPGAPEYEYQPAHAAPREEAPQGEINWSERKHTRDKSRSARQVVVAVCIFLVLLIAAILIVFGKMIFGGNTGTPADNKGGDSLLTEAGDVTELPSETAILPAEDVTEAPTEAPSEALTEAVSENTEDPDAAVLNPGQQPDGQQTDTQQPDGQQTEPTQAQVRQELPPITDVDETVYAISDVNVRDYPGTQGSTVIGVLTGGQSVKRTGTANTGWSRVEFNGKTAYVSSKYLSTSKNDVAQASSDGTVTVNRSGVNMRDVPNGTIIATVNQGDKVTPTGKTSGAWSEVTVNGKTGYIYTSYLTGSGNSGNNSNEKLTETGDTVYAVSGVNVRSAPAVNGSTVLTTLTTGQKVERIGTVNGWSKVKVGSVVGYVYSDYLSTTKGGSSNNSSDNNNSGSKSTSGYILPESDTRVYSQSELSKLSKSQLRLARNEIYARHGRKFNSKDLQDYFNSCSWYKGTVDAATFDANVTSYLNDYEIENLSAITKAEG